VNRSSLSCQPLRWIVHASLARWSKRNGPAANFGRTSRANCFASVVRNPAPSLTLLHNPDQALSVSWTGSGTLEQTESLTAPNWQPATTQDNPHAVSTKDPLKFFRVKAN